MTEQLSSSFPEQILSQWSAQGLLANSLNRGMLELTVPMNTTLMNADLGRVPVVSTAFPSLERKRAAFAQLQKQHERKKNLTLEEIVADHDLIEASTSLESNLNPLPSNEPDDSASDLDGIFDDEEAGAENTPGVSRAKLVTPTASIDQAQNRFKPFHEEKWNARLKELIVYRKEHGDCLVPHTYNPNPQLARWVKRQRRQYKLMLEGRASTMTPERLKILNDIDFVWDSHEAAWQEKLNELNAYRKIHGNCLVPSNYKKNPQLATWVKCQRRQYKLYWEGRPSAMTPDRIVQLEKFGFEWEIRSSGQTSIDRSDYLLLSEAISKMK